MTSQYTLTWNALVLDLLVVSVRTTAGASFNLVIGAHLSTRAKPPDYAGSSWIGDAAIRRTSVAQSAVAVAVEIANNPYTVIRRATKVEIVAIAA